MRYLSVCSGIEAATVAWHPLGWEAAAYSEIEKFPSQVLAHHYPNTPNVGDMTKFKEWTNVSDVDVLVGGTPCQSFSVAGLRKGLDDPRGNLMLTYLAIAAKYRPKWLVWENVPGVLSSNGGLDFASLLRGMGELGYGFAYRILDAQYFGVAQRRRRVFVVGYLGNWRPAAAVLFERHSLCGYSAPSREKGKGVAANARAGVESRGAITARMVAFGEYIDDGTASAMKARDYKDATDLVTQPVYELHSQDSRVKELDDVCSTVSATYGAGGGNVPVTIQPIALAENTIGRKPENGGNGDGFTENGPMYTLNATGVHGVAQPIPLDMMNIRGRPSDDGRANRIGRGYGEVGDPMFTITKANHHAVAQPIATHEVAGTMLSRNTSGGFSNSIDHAAAGYMALQSMAVRRLTPVECERLQGFPDNYTNIKDKCPDGPRYKALGNSMAVPVMAWIGKRIQEVEAINAP